MSECQNVKISKCQTVKISNCKNVKLSKCQIVKCQNVKLSQYQMSCIIRVCRLTQRIDCVLIFSIFYSLLCRYVGPSYFVDIVPFFHNVHQISQFSPNFTISTKFHIFNQISHFQPNLTFSTKFHNSHLISQFRL